VMSSFVPSHQNVGLGSWPARRARQIPTKVAWTFRGRDTSYSEVQHRVDRLAAALSSLGVMPGDRVGFVGANQPALLEVLFASGRLGAITVLINPRLAEHELRYILADSGTKVLFRGPAAIESAHLVGHDELPSLERVFNADDELEALLQTEAFAPDVPSGWDDPCLIMYTSGTTGSPKGAVLTHGNIFFNDVNAILEADLRPDDIALAAAPMFHIAMLNGLVLPVFLKGGRSIIHEAFKPDEVVATIEAEKVTSLFAVPAMMEAISQSPLFEASDITSLRTVIVGGAPAPLPMLVRWKNKGVEVQQGYGLTETSPAVLKVTSDDAVRKIGSAGKEQMFVDVRIVDVDGNDVGPGGTGEILTRGPNVFPGYWNREDATAAAFVDGWFKTGDIASIDDEGFITLRDRAKDMYISGGENVYPAEIESALLEIEGILEAAVIGIPDERWGEVGRAFVVLAEGLSLDLDSVNAKLDGRLARYKLPRSLVAIDSMPRNTTGKLLKQELRKREV
jgi:fatty-acyl-CoA synthase